MSHMFLICECVCNKLTLLYQYRNPPHFQEQCTFFFYCAHNGHNDKNKRMKILSVDVGWRNLSYVIMEVTAESFNIVEWEVVSILDESIQININDTSIEQLINICSQKLTQTIEQWSTHNLEIAYMESQPLGQMARNVKTKTLSHIMQCLLLGKGVKVEFISPKKKLKGMQQTGSYYENKKFAVEKTRELLKDNLVNLTKLGEHSKKDDLADCFLQGLYAARESFIIKKVRKTNTKVKKPKRDTHTKTQNSLIIDLDSSII